MRRSKLCRKRCLGLAVPRAQSGTGDAHGVHMLSDESPRPFDSLPATRPSGPPFVGRVLIVAGIALLGLLVVHLREVLVLAFGCVLVAVVLRSGASALRRLTGLGDRVALTLLLIGLAALIAHAGEVPD